MFSSDELLSGVRAALTQLEAITVMERQSLPLPVYERILNAQLELVSILNPARVIDEEETCPSGQ